MANNSVSSRYENWYRRILPERGTCEAEAVNLLAGEAACIRAVYGPVWVLPVFGTSVPGIVRPGRGTPMGRRTGRLMEI